MAEADNKETICWGILYTRRKHQAWIKRRRRVYGYECICKQAGRQAGRQQAGRQAGRQAGSLALTGLLSNSGIGNHGVKSFFSYSG